MAVEQASFQESMSSIPFSSKSANSGWEAIGRVDERVRQAGLLYELAVHTGDAAALGQADRELDAAEADLAVARGRISAERASVTGRYRGGLRPDLC